MGQGIAGLTLIALALAFAGLSARLLAGVRKAGSAAELLVSLFFLGLACELFGYWIHTGPPGIENGVSIAFSSLALLAFVRSVFRPDERWALGLSVVLGLAIAGVFVLPHVLGEPTPLVRLFWSALRGAALLWAFVECSLYYAKVSRRARLGLAHPVVANRFLLWSLWTGAAALMPLSGLVLRALAHFGLVRDFTLSRELSAGVLVFAGYIFSILVVSAVSLWLSFFPPTRYRQWLVRRASLETA